MLAERCGQATQYDSVTPSLSALLQVLLFFCLPEMMSEKGLTPQYE